MFEKVRGSVRAIALLVLACPACSSGVQDASLAVPSLRTRTTRTSAALENPSVRHDRELTLFLERQLAEHDSGESVTVHVHRDVVLLDGHLPHLLAKKYVEAIAAQTFGVVRVDSRLAVHPPWRMDSAIESDVRRALSLHPALTSTRIHVAVDGAEVTLSGEVDSHFQRAISEEIAAGVRGVKNVIAPLEIAPPHEYDDNQLRERIAKQLERDTRLDTRNVRVRVRSGRVVLIGTMPSERERRIAQNLSAIDGVREVNASALHVRWSRNMPPLRPRTLSDQSTLDVITRAIACNAWQNVEHLSLRVDRDGTVTIGGEVQSLAAKRAIVDIVSSTLGVTQLIDRLSVLPSPLVDDEILEERVSDILGMNPYLDDETIELRVQDGIVLLVGNVRSPLARTEADRSAAHVAGVRAIDNRLEIATRADGRL
jgi:osmotically-inducible protein OsmY